MVRCVISTLIASHQTTTFDASWLLQLSAVEAKVLNEPRQPLLSLSLSLSLSLAFHTHPSSGALAKPLKDVAKAIDPDMSPVGDPASKSAAGASTHAAKAAAGGPPSQPIHRRASSPPPPPPLAPSMAEDIFRDNEGISRSYTVFALLKLLNVLVARRINVRSTQTWTCFRRAHRGRGQGATYPEDDDQQAQHEEALLLKFHDNIL